jgi:hypothetical protein
MFELEDAEFRKNSVSYAWIVEGTRKVSTPLSDGGTETYNYDLWGSMDRLRIVERNGVVTKDPCGYLKRDRSQKQFT